MPVERPIRSLSESINKYIRPIFQVSTRRKINSSRTHLTIKCPILLVIITYHLSIYKLMTKRILKGRKRRNPSLKSLRTRLLRIDHLFLMSNKFICSFKTQVMKETIWSRLTKSTLIKSPQKAKKSQMKKTQSSRLAKALNSWLWISFKAQFKNVASTRSLAASSKIDLGLARMKMSSWDSMKKWWIWIKQSWLLCASISWEIILYKSYWPTLSRPSQDSSSLGE